MKLRCCRCKKYLDEEQFSIGARVENKKNWVGTGSLQSNTTLIEVRGGRSYLCRNCTSDSVNVGIKNRRVISGEHNKKSKVRRTRRYLRDKYIKEGYNKEEADHMSFDKVPYIWNIEGFIWSEPAENWIQEK